MSLAFLIFLKTSAVSFIVLLEDNVSFLPLADFNIFIFSTIFSSFIMVRLAIVYLYLSIMGFIEPFPYVVWVIHQFWKTLLKYSSYLFSFSISDTTILCLYIIIIPIPKNDSTKEYSKYHTIELISHASKVMLKILQSRLQQYVNQEIPDVQAGFRKGRGMRDHIARICWIT